MTRCPACGEVAPADARFCPRDGAPVAAQAADPLIGSLVGGRYRVTARLGMGGMAVVYLARHNVLDRDIALKVLRRDIAQDGDAVARFAREARTASRIDHDNVVHVLDFGWADDGFYYLVMEHVAGVGLDRELVRCVRLAPSRVVHVVSQVAAGVGRAHELGIVHRDLKPENVVLTQRHGDPDFAKVLDFGLAKAVEPSSIPSITVAGQIFGTPEFMAPEQWASAEPDPRTDIYALGVMTYQLLTGQVPFRGPSVGAVMKGHLLDAPAPLRSRAPDANIPELLEHVVMRCLVKDPAGRFGSCRDLLAALAPFWETTAPAARRTTYAAPARIRDSAIPDPTVYQSNDFDMVWDGPLLCDEIARLHALRRKRLADLATALWGSSELAVAPRDVGEILAPIAELEAAAESIGEDVALLRAQSEEHDQKARESEAALRLELISISLQAGVAQRRLPASVAPLGALADSLAETLERRPVDRSLHTPDLLARAARDVELRLAAQLRRRRTGAAQIELALGRRVAELRIAEDRLAPLYEKLFDAIRTHARSRPDVRPLLVAFGQLDGAIASYQALLALVQD